MCSFFLCCFHCCRNKPPDNDAEAGSNRGSSDNEESVHSPAAAPLGRSEQWRILSHQQPTLPDTNLVVWGVNAHGELGLGNLTKVSSATTLRFPHKVKSVSCGEAHTLFVLEDGTLYSCGSNDCGQLGHDKDNKTLQFVTGFEGPVISAKAGYAHSVAIDSAGKVYSWGSNSHGQLGLEIKTNKKIIKQPQIVASLLNKTVIQIAVGQYHSAVLTSYGEIYTCGCNSNGQLGQGSDASVSQRKFGIVKGLIGFPTALIVSGGFHCLALSVSGVVYGWGKNSSGQLGVGDTEDKWQPTGLRSVRSLVVKYIAAGLEHTAFLTKDGGLFTCGNGIYGQLGHDSFSNSILPRKVLEFGSVVCQIACGHNHTLCFNGNRLYYFGLDSSNVFGKGEIKFSSPLQVNITEGVHSIFAGGHQSFISAHNDNSDDVNSKDYRVRGSKGQIFTITEDCINTLISITEPVSSEMEEFAQLLLSSPSSWNASFLTHLNQDPCTIGNIGIDLELSEATLSKMSTIKSEKVKELVDNIICNTLMSSLPTKIEYKEMLRVYVLLPQTPSFYFGDIEATLISYTQKVLVLEPKMLNIVVHWLYFSPMEQILRLISLYKKTIVSVLGSSNWNDSQKDNMCKTCLIFLSLLYILNKTNLRLSYHIFAIPQLSSKINITVDYLKWIEKYSFAFCDYPFVFDDHAKIILLQTDQAVQMKGAMNKAVANKNVTYPLQADSLTMSFLLLNVNRNKLVEDVITQIQFLDTNELKKPIRIKFIGEEAEDAGGVRKEFFLLLISEILDAKFGMFTHYNESRLMWFNGNSFEDTMMYSLIGIVCGLAIYNFTIINLPFPLALYKKLLDEKVDLSDLKELNPLVGRSLEQILEYTEPDLESVFSLNFEVSQESYGQTTVVPLKEGGSNVSVTQENKAEFIDLYVNHVFNNSAQKQFNAFKEGFERVCGSSILQLFHPTELQTMVTGNEDYIWGELEENCTYERGYSAGHEVIKRFWLIFHSLTHEEKKQFLLFLTGSDRIPIAGMKEIKMSIQPLDNKDYLPVAHTCFDLLDLPPYRTDEIMKMKLIQAIQQHQGFSLI